MRAESEVFTAISHPARRRMLDLLVDGDCPVNMIATNFDMSRPAVSQHLKVLKDARLVVDQRAGNRRIYRVDPDGLDTLRADLDQFWSKALATYKAVVEQRTEEV